MKIKKYHLVVIGAGSAGLVTSSGASGLGAKVALVEKNKMGGDCLYTGCVPSKTIIKTAKMIYQQNHLVNYGLTNLHSDYQWEKVFESVQNSIEIIQPNDSPERFRKLGVDIYFGEFKFINPYEVSNGEITLKAKRIVIATGARPIIPKIPGLENIYYLTSENIWQLKEKPKTMLIIGAGPIGCEMAQVFHRLGVDVSLLDISDRILIKEDQDSAELLKQQFIKEGIKIYLSAKPIQIIKNRDTHFIEIEIDNLKTKIPFEKILIATGRSPRVDHLGLNEIGVEYSSQGIKVDNKLRTSKKHIYACGDVISPYQYTHTADYEARLVIRNALFPGKTKIDYQLVPKAVFTDPELAQVGYHEQSAQQAGIDYDLYQVSMKEVDRAICEKDTLGFLKVLTKKNTDQIIGATMIGNDSADLIHQILLAMHQKIGLKSLANMIHIYPTRAEIFKKVIDNYQRTRLTKTTKSWLTKYFRFRFGK